MTDRLNRYAAWGALANAVSAVVGFVGYSAAPAWGEPFTSLGYAAFIVWAIALLPIMLMFHRAPGRSTKRVRLVTLIIGLVAVSMAIVIQSLLLFRLATLEQITASNFTAAGAVGLWLFFGHVFSGRMLPRHLNRLGMLVGILWTLAFVLLGAAGFPAGGAHGNTIAALGFAADASAYFASIAWAVWLGLTLLHGETSVVARHEASGGSASNRGRLR